MTAPGSTVGDPLDASGVEHMAAMAKIAERIALKDGRTVAEVLATKEQHSTGPWAEPEWDVVPPHHRRL